ncbi:MAG: TlpA disulfide reductase family protein [Balneolaceae bacterium]|jgi:thiol-disulfide isomerase/thioredoxin
MKITGHLDYTGSADIFFSKQPIHYKYAATKRFPVSPSEKGLFTLTIPVDSMQLINLNIGDKTYPLIAEPGKSLKLEIDRALFPGNVKVKGYSQPWDSLYAAYHKREIQLIDKINAQLPAFRDGDSTDVLSLYEDRYQLAGTYFRQTPLADLYYKAIGEYLVKQLEDLKYRRMQPGIKPEARRQEILDEAQKLNFFSFESLYAQRAGIRDFTNAFANTFGVKDSLDREFNQNLMEYDVKRLGYEKLDSARTSILQYIKERKAKAYARMFLVAERIGELPLHVSTPGYKNYINEFADFPEYTSFLQSFYTQIKQVSPGQPAVPFSLPDQNEEIIHMKDYLGKYILLDFWASWCIPCLDEFPYMRNIYHKYPRDKFQILGISIEEDSLRWRQSIKRFKNPWPQLYGGNEFRQKTFRAYRGGGIPFYILVGPEGNILRYNDIRPSFNLPNVLDSLLSES